MTMYLPNPVVHPAESDPVEFLELPRMAIEGRAETSASVERRDSTTVHLGSPANDEASLAPLSGAAGSAAAKGTSTMPDTPDDHPDRQLQLLRELAAANAPIAGDVTKISGDLWAIHGVIPVDGDVILAEFASYDEARRTLDHLTTGSDGNSDP